MIRGEIIAGLYAITPDVADTETLIRMVRQVLIGGARLLQYRNKTANDALRLEQARSLRALCQEFRIPLIVNDHVDLAVEVEAEGVHLGGDDAPIAHARSKLGSGKLIGASCYNNLDNAFEAARLGADYVAFGAFFASTTKPGAAVASWNLLKRAKTSVHIPIVAIGGITTRNAKELIAEGAEALAVSSALFNAPDIETEAEAFARLFAQSPNSPARVTQ